MATIIKIGHASISENNTAYGQAGDSTSKEVCIKSDFSIADLTPNVVLRPKSEALAEASAKACEDGCANDNIGYSQSTRNTLNTYASAVSYDLSKVSTKCNADCSAFMTVCAIAGGARIAYGTNAPTTTNMRTRFKQSGDYTVLTDTKHLTKTDYLKRGDILVHEGRHTVMVLANGKYHEDDESESEVTTGITKVSNVRTYIIDTTVTDIKDTSAAVKFKVIERLNNVEKTVTKTSKWTFKLVLTTLPNLATTEHQFTSTRFNLTGLKSGHSYFIQVIALKADGSVAFTSAQKLLTIPKKTGAASKPVELSDKDIGKPLKLINKVYVKVQDQFKQVIIHKNK